jgi:hypothetical protein
VFADDALVAIAEKALERETGARGLRSIIEEALLDVHVRAALAPRRHQSASSPSETIEKGLDPTLVTVARRRWKLARPRRSAPAGTSSLRESGGRFQPQRRRSAKSCKLAGKLDLRGHGAANCSRSVRSRRGGRKAPPQVGMSRVPGRSA